MDYTYVLLCHVNHTSVELLLTMAKAMVCGMRPLSGIQRPYCAGKNFSKRSNVVMCTYGDENAELLGWMRRAEPCQVLGLSDEDFSLNDVKAAFRSKVKEYHPDVYKGPEDAEAITQCLIQAYQQLALELKEGVVKRNFDPFEEPEGEAEDIFVNELLCIGKGCPYSCVQRVPSVFTFAPDTGRARVVTQGESGDYNVQLAVGQCPRNCIHFVTTAQREVLEGMLERTVADPYSSEAMTMQGLIVRANFENGRYRGPKRKPKRSDGMMDYY